MLSMNLDDKIAWMESWCKEQGLALALEAWCGIARPCVGVLSLDPIPSFPDYIWYDEEYNRLDTNGEIWIPEKAYSKHGCIAVSGQGEDSIEQLYEWLRWFSDNNFKYVCETVVCTDPLELEFGRGKHHKMVKQ